MRYSNFILCLSLSYFLTSSTGCAQNSTNECDNFFKLYKEFKIANLQDTLAFIEVSSDVLNKSSTCIEAYLTRADLYFLIDSIESAKNDYQRILKLDSTNIYAHYQIGIINHIEETYDSSIYYFLKALELKKYGNILIDYSRFGEEFKTSKAKFDIESSEIMYWLGQSYYYNRELNKAFYYFDYCIKNNYLLDKSFLYRGAIILENKQKDNRNDACKDFSESLKHGNPDAKLYIDKYCIIEK